MHAVATGASKRTEHCNCTWSCNLAHHNPLPCCSSLLWLSSHHWFVHQWCLHCRGVPFLRGCLLPSALWCCHLGRSCHLGRVRRCGGCQKQPDMCQRGTLLKQAASRRSGQLAHVCYSNSWQWHLNDAPYTRHCKRQANMPCNLTDKLQASMYIFNVCTHRTALCSCHHCPSLACILSGSAGTHTSPCCQGCGWCNV
jgi:hypothetical protein